MFCCNDAAIVVKCSEYFCTAISYNLPVQKF